jgi:hypothetical protein
VGRSFIAVLRRLRYASRTGPVASGDKVEVLGVPRGDELIPDEMIISTKWSHHAIYLRSLLGLALVLFVFAKYWTFDRCSLRFTPKRKREEEKRNA